MRTVNYSEILTGSAALAGLGPNDIGMGELALFTTFHDRRLQQAWEIHRWPDLCPVEQRTFRTPWSASTTYAGPTTTAAVEVYDPASGQYFQSLQGGNLNNAPTTNGVVNLAWWAASMTGYSAEPWVSGAVYSVGDQVQNPTDLNYYQCITAHTAGGSFDASKFGLLTPFNRYVAYQQTDVTGAALTPIGEFLRAFDKDPRVTTKLVDIPFWISQMGAQFTQVRANLGFVWLYYRKQRPSLLGAAWDSTLVYTSGQQVYYVGTGAGAAPIAPGVANLFTANQTTTAGDSPETAAAKWTVVPIPYIFRSFLIAAGHADWLLADGQNDKAAALEGAAMAYLELEADKLNRQQGQGGRLIAKATNLCTM